VPDPGLVSPPGAIRGHWVTLEPIGDHNLAEVRALDDPRRLTPAMGGPYHVPTLAGRYGPAVAVRENQTGRVVGVLENDEMLGYPGVAVFIIFVDQRVARPGLAMEACGIYVPLLFAHGAQIVHFEVLAFNRYLTHLFDHRGHPPQVRMRRHAYVAGRYWDLLFYALDAAEYEATFGKFDRVLPGGHRPISALSGSGPPP
jgi:hypothetical protein